MAASDGRDAVSVTIHHPTTQLLKSPASPFGSHHLALGKWRQWSPARCVGNRGASHTGGAHLGERSFPAAVVSFHSEASGAAWAVPLSTGEQVPRSTGAEGTGPGGGSRTAHSGNPPPPRRSGRTAAPASCLVLETTAGRTIAQEAKAAGTCL